MDPRAGLAWKQAEGWFAELEELRPTWTIEPNIEAITEIVRHAMQFPEDLPCSVEFLAQGSFNKVYTVRYGGGCDLIVRVSLPVQPRLKTMNEWATIEYLRHHTDMPIPCIFDYKAMRDDKLGFEWIIMERVTGTKVKEQWHQMSWSKKELLVHQVVVFLAQLFRKRFDRLGGLYTLDDIQEISPKDRPLVHLDAAHSGETTDFCQSEIVSIPFFYNDRWNVDVLRGPYKSSRRWLAARLQLALHDASNMSDGQDEASDTTDSDDGIKFDEFNTREAIIARIERMMDLLPQVFPTNKHEEFVLHHQDLTDNNMMVNAKHDLSGIIDWECVHTVPLWLACTMPRLLRGANTYSPPAFETEWENEYYEESYYEYIELYEKTQLRAFFLEDMQRVCPEWIRVYEDNNIENDFEFAITLCTMRGGYGKSIDRWLEAVENGGQPRSLRKSWGQC